jgi:multicomponent Na+:H+ antiporter subunit D
MDFRRLLSFHIVSQIGYALMGLGLFSRMALAAAIFFTLHVSIAKAALFLASGVVHRLQGSYDLKKLGGLFQPAPVLSVLFLLPALSLAGLPPLSGFWAKFALVRAGLETAQYTIVAVALGVSVLTLFSMTKIWAEVFWKPQPASEAVEAEISTTKPSLGLLLPLALLASFSVVMGLLAEPFFALASQAAEQLLYPADYINAVLEGGR